MQVVWRAVMGVGKVLVGEAKIVHLVPVVHLVPRLITSERHGREGGGVFHGPSMQMNKKVKIKTYQAKASEHIFLFWLKKNEC